MVCTGTNHNLILTNQGDIYGWGQNDMGQLKDNQEGYENIVSFPQKVPINDKFTFISA